MVVLLGPVEMSFAADAVADLQHGRLCSSGCKFVLNCLRNSHLAQFKLTQHFSEDEVAHW
jgi:hypothetical protein